MDLRNLCSKIDVDTLRAKIPPLPQIKLPKSMPKLKSRKIFRSSQEDVNSTSRRASSRSLSDRPENTFLSLAPPSGLINRTPTRISTISSLMNLRRDERSPSAFGGSERWKSNNNDDNENSYCNAGGIDDYYPSPLKKNAEPCLSRPISPMKVSHVLSETHAHSEQNVKMSLGEKLQKGYKDVAEFKLKHLFAKRTLVRSDKIEIADYIPQFDDDRRREEKRQQTLDRDIADNFRFKFKVSQQKSDESYMDDSLESSPQRSIKLPINHKNLSEHSGDESGMESSPPPRKPGIAATRFSRVRHTPLDMSLEYNVNDDHDTELNVEVVPKIKPKNSFHKVKKQKSPLEAYQATENMSHDIDSDQNEHEEDEPKLKTKSSFDNIKKIKSTKECQIHNEDSDIELNVEDLDEPNRNDYFYNTNNNKPTFNFRQNTANTSLELENNIKSYVEDINLPKIISKDSFCEERKIKSTVVKTHNSSNISPENNNNEEDDEEEFFEINVEDEDVPKLKSKSNLRNDKKDNYSNVRQATLNSSLEFSTDDFDDFKYVPKKVNTSKRIKTRSYLHDLRKQKSYYSEPQISANTENDDGEDDIQIKPNRSSLYDIRNQKSPENSNVKRSKPKSIKERISRFSKQKLDADETITDSEKKHEASMGPQHSNGNDLYSDHSKSNKRFDSIKQNFKRIQKSVRLPQQIKTISVTESENDENSSNSKIKLSKSQQFTERLKRFRSTDHVDKNAEDEEHIESPINKITNKLQEWKQNIKKKVDNEDVDNTFSPQKQEKTMGSLMKKLKHIRSRKRDSTEDPDDDEENGGTYKESLAARAKLQLEKSVVAASQVPQMTIKKISESKKYFKKKQEINDISKPDKRQSDEEEIEINVEKKNTMKSLPKTLPRPPPPVPRPNFDNPSDEEDVGNKKFISKSLAESKLIAVPAATAAWTTKAIISDDVIDLDEELPRVLLHQDNSDVFESTLIIAVTRPMSRAITPIITELADFTEDINLDKELDSWVPNTGMIESFSNITPISERKSFKDSYDSLSSKEYSRKDSIDSNSDDSWIRDIPKGPSTAVLNSVNEYEEAWKIQKETVDYNLYKTKSIDLFEMQKRHGGVLCAFEDFDDELKNTPVIKIEKEIEPIPAIEVESADLNITENNEPLHSKIIRDIDNYSRGSSEELESVDDDNSSRITKISVNPQNVDILEEDSLSKLQPQKELEFGISKISACPQEEFNNAIDENSSITKTSIHQESLKLNSELICKPCVKNQVIQPDNLNNIHNKECSIDNQNVESYEHGDTIVIGYKEEEKVAFIDLGTAKSPPPSRTPTPPPLPQREIYSKQSTLSQLDSGFEYPFLPPPPLPLTKPPIPSNRPTPQPPPIIPHRNTSATRITKPLVKTASLRLAYSEQLNPEDVGKVNKLISRFEPGGLKQRPRIIVRKPIITDESEEYSGEEDLIVLMPKKQQNKIIDLINSNNLSTLESIDATEIKAESTDTLQIISPNIGNANEIPDISVSSSCLDVNENFNRPSSLYNSPYDISSSKEATPLKNQNDSEHLKTRRNRRSMPPDEEHFYSFDSDEENSYYSISSTGSNRYVVDL